MINHITSNYRHSRITLAALLITVLTTSTATLRAENGWSMYTNLSGAALIPEADPREKDLLEYGLITASLPASDELVDFQTASLLDLARRERNVAGQWEFNLGVERQFLQDGSLGVHLELTAGQGELSCRHDCPVATDLTRLRLLSLESTGTAIQANPVLLLPFANLAYSEKKYEFALLEVGMNYYFAPGSEWKPFLGIDLGIGTCKPERGEGGEDCMLGRVTPRLGLRYDFDTSIFLQLQAELQLISVRHGRGEFTSSDQFAGPAVSLGMGYRL